MHTASAHSTNMPSPQADVESPHSGGDVEVDDGACFSEDEADAEAPDASAAEALRGGFDFSGRVSADAAQALCPLCNKPLEPSWDDERGELVVLGGVMLRHVLYHKECVRYRSLRVHAERLQASQQQQPAAASRGPADPRLAAAHIAR